MPRGSRPGEHRGGRKAGTPNKATAEVKATAQKYTKESIDTLATIMRSGESEQARIAAAKELLDRAHGKPAQAVTGPDGEQLMVPQAVSFIIQQLPEAVNRT